jgi:hypothetical protein
MNVPALPATFLVDKRGKIVLSLSGKITNAKLKKLRSRLQRLGVKPAH